MAGRIEDLVDRLLEETGDDLAAKAIVERINANPNEFESVLDYLNVHFALVAMFRPFQAGCRLNFPTNSGDKS